MKEPITFFKRVALAFISFFAVLFNRDFALAVFRVRESQKALPGGSPAVLPEKVVELVPSQASLRRDALHLLSVLQRDGRFVDFLQEDLSNFSDDEVGAASRAVHEGCRKAVSSYFSLEPVFTQAEGSPIVVEKGFDPAKVRLSGNVVGDPPFRGSLRHHGWRVKEVTLPSAPDGQDPAIIAPAEVEL